MIKKTRKWYINTITQEDFDKKELVKNLFTGELQFAEFFAYDFNSYGILDTICCIPKNIIEKRCLNNDYYVVMWNARILLTLVHNAPMNMDQDFYFFIFKNILQQKKELILQIEKQFLDCADSMPISEGLDTINCILELKNIDSNMVFALQPSITKYWKKIATKIGSEDFKKFEMRYKEINPLDILSIYSNIDEEELPIYVGNPATFLTNENSIKNLMTQLFLFHNPSICNKLQTLLSLMDFGAFAQKASVSCVILEPIYKPVEDTILFLSANQSLSSKEHFIDIFWKKKMKYLITHFSNEKESFPQIRYLDDLYPFFFVACFEQLYPQENNFLAVIQKLFPKNTDKYSQVTDVTRSKIAQIRDLIKRVENDTKLVFDISSRLGKTITLENLSTKSIPLILKGNIFNCDKSLLSMIFQTKSFLVSEYDMINSESFLYAPKIYCAIIDYVVGNKQEIPDDFREYKKYFNVTDIREKIFLDIYSLIFLKDKKGDFYCDIKKADGILQFITLFFNGNGGMIEKEKNLIKNSRQHIIFAQLHSKDDLQSAIFSYENYLINCIVNNEFKTAETLGPTLGSPRLKSIVQMLSYLRDPQTKSIDDQNKYCFAVEFYFSTNNIKEWLTDQTFIDSQQYFSDSILTAIQNLIDLYHFYDDPLSLYRKQQNLLHTSTFEAYKEIYSKFESVILKDKNSIYYDHNKRLEPSEIIRILHESEIETNMDNLVTLLGSHALEFLLLYTPDFNEKIYKLVESESPITSQAIRYEFAIKGNYVYQNKDSVYERLLAKKAGYSEDEEFEIISTDFEAILDSHDSTLTQLTNDEIGDLIEKYVNMNPLPVENLNSLYLRAPAIYCEKIKYIVRNDLQRFNVSDLLELYPFCGMKSLPLLERMNVRTLDVESVINILMEKTRFLTLKLFLDDLKQLYEINNKSEEEEEEEKFLQIVSTYIKNHRESIHVIPKRILDKIDIEQFLTSNSQQDYEICYLIESISDLNYYLERSDEDFDVSETIEIINRLLQPLVIDNNFRELIQRQIRKLSIVFSKRFKHSFSTKLRALSSMLSRDLLGRYGIVISLANFSSETFGSNVARIHLKYDFFKECQEICAAWSLDLSLYKAEIALSAFKIGLVNEGMDFISPPIRNDILVDQIVDVLSNNFVFDCSPIMETEDPIEKVKIAMNYGTRWINIQVASGQDDQPIVINIKQYDTALYAESPQIKALHKLLTALNSLDKLIMFYASKGYFEYAFDAWNTIKRAHTKSELFIRSIVFPALVFQNWQLLWSRVRKMHDPEQEKENPMKQYVSDLFKFLNQKKMGETAFNIQMSLNMYPVAFKTANDYFVEMKSWEGQLRIIEAMKKASKRMKDVKKDVMAKLDFEENYIIKPCIQENIPFSNALNIMTTKKNALQTAVFLVKKGEVDTVMLKLLPMLLFTLDEMNHALLDDAMMQGETGAMHKLFMALEKANEQNYEAIIFNLFLAISTRIKDTNSLSNFIDENVKDELKGPVLASLGFFDQAYDFAVKTHDTPLMEMVRDNAERKGDKELYLKADNYLQNQKK